MKKIITPVKLVCLIVLLVGLNSCNVKEVLTDSTGQNKSFILLNPNFLTTNYQIRLFDTANKFIDQEMTVEVFSSKKIVNEEGYYKNTFTTSNGLLNFSVDPNEVISESDPIKISFKITSNNNAYLPKIIKEFVGTNSFDRIFKVVFKKNNLENATSTVKANATNSVSSKKASYYNQSTHELFTIGGIEIPIYVDASNAILTPRSITGSGIIVGINDEYSANLSESTIFLLSPSILEKDLPIKLTFRNILDRNTMAYSYTVVYDDVNGNQIRLNISSDGQNSYQVWDQVWREVKLPNNPSWTGNIIIPKGSKMSHISISTTRTNTELKSCPTGFNFKFNNIAKGTLPELVYIVYRNDAPSGKFYITNAGVTKVSEQYPTFNTGDLLYSNIKNKVVFSENSQYLVTPSTIELAGNSSCGSTTNITITPKADLTLYKLAVKTQCESDNFGIVANANVLFRKKGTTNWEGLSIKNGIGTVYLENNAVYEVTGNYGKSNFSFNFTNDPSLFETQKSESLSKNKDLKNITYKISTETTGTKLLNIDLVLAQAACPLN